MRRPFGAWTRASAALVLLVTGCGAPKPKLPPGWDLGANTHAFHDGPLVAHGVDGPARFVQPVLDEFDAEAAMNTVAYVDRFYREPANEGYDATLDRVLEGLREAGFGTREGLELAVESRSRRRPAWTPRSAELGLVAPGAAPEVLLSFGPGDDRSRTMLPTNAPTCDVEGPLALDLASLARGAVLVTDAPLGAVLARAEAVGAVAVLSSHLRDYNIDPTGRERHQHAILYSGVPSGTRLAVAQISPAVQRRLERAGAGARVRLRAEVELAERPLRTVIATVTGARLADEVVPMVAHVQEPGANDNASGVAGLLEAARALARLVESGGLERQARSVAFVWGDEYAASETFLEANERRVVAAFSADMVGASKQETGAICLLERAPDPGALTSLAPDAHTPWGAGDVDAEDIVPSGLSIVTRLALVDVGLAAGAWETREHPWEGGSDHDVFLARGVPAVLLWHFTDFAYHTSLDRLEHVDPRELELTCVALLCAALSVADARPTDLDRYLKSLSLERRMRTSAVVEAGADPALGEAWKEWFTGARHWLREICLDLETGE